MQISLCFVGCMVITMVVSLSHSTWAKLVPNNAPPRRSLCQCFMQQSSEDPVFRETVLFTDESCFTMIVITSIHDEHVWSDENPQEIRSHHKKTAVFYQPVGWNFM
jgi:hypothetical protein